MRIEMKFILLAVMIAMFSLACGGDDSDSNDNLSDGDQDTVEDGDVSEDGDAEPFEPAVTTVSKTLVPEVEFLEFCKDSADRRKLEYCKNPATYEQDFDVYFKKGMGEWSVEDGEPLTLREDLGVAKGEPGTRQAILSWAQFTDVHITDEESPSRTASFDSTSIPSALRPQDMYTQRVFADAIKTINRFIKTGTLDFTLVTGDATDTAQYNEMKALLDIMNGELIDPDSGADDDPVAGENNDGQDPFQAEALEMPFYLALGNHDELIMGNWKINEKAKAVGVGSLPGSGTRRGDDFLVTKEEVPADENRESLYHDEMIDLIMNTPGLPEGHGYTQNNIDENNGYYAFDAPNGAPVRFIVLDTTFRPLGFEGSDTTYVSGVIDRVQFEHFLQPELEDAFNDHKLVVLASHEQSDHLQNDGFDDGRFISEEEFLETTLSYPNIVLHCVGHGHTHRVRIHTPEDADGDGGYFEIETTSLIDFPQQFRFFEMVDNGNGTLSINSAVVDHQGEEGGMSELSRKLTLIDSQTGWDEQGMQGSPETRNIEMIVPIPEGWQGYVSDFEGRETIDAEVNW